MGCEPLGAVAGAARQHTLRTVGDHSPVSEGTRTLNIHHR